MPEEFKYDWEFAVKQLCKDVPPADVEKVKRWVVLAYANSGVINLTCDGHFIVVGWSEKFQCPLFKETIYGKRKCDEAVKDALEKLSSQDL